MRLLVIYVTADIERKREKIRLGMFRVDGHRLDEEQQASNTRSRSPNVAIGNSSESFRRLGSQRSQVYFEEMWSERG